MKFKYIKFWLRWYWKPYTEVTVFDIVFRWLCFEALWSEEIKVSHTYLANETTYESKPTKSATSE